MVNIKDEAGGDAKLLAVPIDKVLPIYSHWKSYRDINSDRLAQIQHFFENYKDLEKGKWVEIIGWGGPGEAEQEILDGIRRYDEAVVKPQY